jgi:hypothetical protein
MVYVPFPIVFPRHIILKETGDIVLEELRSATYKLEGSVSFAVTI